MLWGPGSSRTAQHTGLCLLVEFMAGWARLGCRQSGDGLCNQERFAYGPGQTHPAACCPWALVELGLTPPPPPAVAARNPPLPASRNQILLWGPAPAVLGPLTCALASPGLYQPQPGSPVSGLHLAPLPRRPWLLDLSQDRLTTHTHTHTLCTPVLPQGPCCSCILCPVWDLAQQGSRVVASGS